MGGASTLEGFRGAPVLAVGRGLQHSDGRCSGFGGTALQNGVQPGYKGVGMKGQSSPFELRRWGCFHRARLCSLDSFVAPASLDARRQKRLKWPRTGSEDQENRALIPPLLFPSRVPLGNYFSVKWR